MAPLSLFRLKKQSLTARRAQQCQRQQNVPIPPRSPDSFFSPDRSPSLYPAADVVFELQPPPSQVQSQMQVQVHAHAHAHAHDDDADDDDDYDKSVEQEQAPYPQHAQEPPEGAQLPLVFYHPDHRDVGPSSLPVSVHSALSATHFITPGPPNLALRLSFDAEGSLGDSIQRYFNSKPDPDPSFKPRHVPSLPLGSPPVSPLPVPQLPHQLAKPNDSMPRAVNPNLPSSTDKQNNDDSSSVYISQSTHQRPIAKNIAKRLHQHAQDPQERPSLHSKGPSVVSGDLSFHESPVLQPSDTILDISPSVSQTNFFSIPSSAKSTTAARTPRTIPRLPSLPLLEQAPPLPPKAPTGTTPRKRVAPAPIKIPNGSMHAPKVIVERVPPDQDQSTAGSGPQVSVVASTAMPVAEPRRPQRHAGRKRSVEEVEDVTGQAEHPRKERKEKEEVVARPRTRQRTVVSLRKSTASTYFASEYTEFTLLSMSSGGDHRLSVAQAHPGRADSATLPEDSPGWQTRRFIIDENEQLKKRGTILPHVPTLHPALLRRSHTVAVEGTPEYEANRVLVVPKRESSLFPSAITAKLLPLALRQSNSSSASEGASSTFSQLISVYQYHNPSSTPQDADAASVHPADGKSSGSNKASSPRRATTASMASEAEITIARTRTASLATQSSTRGASPLTPAGILGLERTVPPPTASANPSTRSATAPANSASQSTTASPILHPLPPPPPHPRNKTTPEDTDAPPEPGALLRDGGGPVSPSWRLTRRTDSLRPSRAVELLKAGRDRDRDADRDGDGDSGLAMAAPLPAPAPASSSSPVPATPGTGLTQYLDMYTSTEGEEHARGREGEDRDPSTGSSSFSTGQSSLFGTSATGRSPYSLYQGTTPVTGLCSSSTASARRPSTASPPRLPTTTSTSTTATAATVAPSPDEQPASKTSHARTVSEALNGHFRTRSVSDAPPITAFAPAKNIHDRRPSMPESSAPGAVDALGSFPPTSSASSSAAARAAGSSRGMPPFTVMDPAWLQKIKSNNGSRSETSSLRSMEGTRPVLQAINTNPPPPPRDLRESMFPHTPHSFSPVDITKSLEPPAPATATAAAAAPPSTIIAPEPASAPERPRTSTDTRTPVRVSNAFRSTPSLRVPMSSASSTFSRRDRTLPIGPRKPTIKRKEQEAPPPPQSDAIPPTRAATTPPDEASSKRPTSVSPQMPWHAHSHSRTRTKSSASTATSASASASVMEKIARPSTPAFDTVQVQWRGLTLDAAKWMFSSSELHAMVGRAIRQSADPMCIRLLPIDLLDRDLPAALDDLEVRRERIKAEYKYQVKRRASLMRTLASTVAGTAPPPAVLKIVEELAEGAAMCDQLSEELFMVSDQIAQINRLQDGHSASALAMALRKINTSFLRATGEAADLKAQVESLTAEREEAWAMAETVERELDELRLKVERMEQQQQTSEQQQQQRHILNVVTSPLSRSNSSKGGLSRSTSRVSAARKSSMRVSKASLRSKSARSSTTSTASWAFSTAVSRTPATNSPLLLVPPVPRIPRGSARNSDSADAYSPSPRGSSQALIDAQNELLEMLGIPVSEWKNGPFSPSRRRSHSAAILSWAKSPPPSPHLDPQTPASPVPVPKGPPASRLFRSASIAEHARLSRRKGEAYSAMDLEMIYDGILDDPETLFAVLKN